MTGMALIDGENVYENPTGESRSFSISSDDHAYFFQNATATPMELMKYLSGRSTRQFDDAETLSGDGLLESFDLGIYRGSCPRSPKG